VRKTVNLERKWKISYNTASFAPAAKEIFGTDELETGSLGPKIWNNFSYRYSCLAILQQLYNEMSG
jgi:hypothetical protein